MEARNCPKCGRMFYYNGKSPICEACEKKEEETFEIVRLYLKENPGSKLSEVSKETGVSAKKITRYLREGRLEVTDGMGDILRCIKCNAPIRTGKYCSSCAAKLSKGLNSLYKGPENVKTKTSDSSPRMRFLNQ